MLLKVRNSGKGDILGTLIKDIEIEAKDIGNITIFEKCSYVAIKTQSYNKLTTKNSLTIKKKNFRIFSR